MYKKNNFKFKIATIASLLLNFSCSTYTFTTVDNKVENNIILKENDNGNYTIYIDGNNKIEKNSVSVKLNISNLFNTKAQVRKNIYDITSIEISLCNSIGTVIGNTYTLFYNKNSDLRYININFKNLPSGTYFARATAKDSGFDSTPGTGDDNVLNQGSNFSLSSNFISVDSSYNLVSPNNNDLIINLNLQNAEKNSTETTLFYPTDVLKQKIALDEKGNGILIVQISPKEIYINFFINYVRVPASTSFNFTSETTLQDIGPITANFTNGKGSIVFVKNYTSSTVLVTKKFSFTENGIYSDNLETTIETVLFTNAYNDLSLKLDSKGDGTLVVSKKDGTGKFNLYTIKYNSYVNSGTLTNFFVDGQSDKTRPVVIVNNKGDGAVIWEDNASGTKEIVYAKLNGYTNFGNGTISASSSTTVNGTGTTFTTNFPNISPKYLRVENNAPDSQLQVQGITNDLSLTLSVAKNFTSKKYGILLSSNDSNIDFAPTFKANISGEGLIIWKSQNGTTFSIKGLKLNNFNPNSNSILNGPTYNSIIDVDNNPVGLAINNSGNGYIVYSVGASSTSRTLERSAFNNYSLTNSKFVLKTASDNLFSPLIALNNSGSGIVTFYYNSPSLLFNSFHIQEYIP